MGIFNRNRKIIAYGLISSEIKNKFLTVSLNKFDPTEYAIELMRLQYQNNCHYQSWCELREADKEDIETWGIYYNDCVPIEEKNKYQIVKISYKIKDIMAIIRMFGNCFPIGCSFDTDIEKTYYKRLQTEAQEIDEVMAKIMAKAQEAATSDKDMNNEH